MPTLNVDVSTDFSADDLVDIDEIVYGDDISISATFDSSQFGGGQVSETVTLTGGAGNNFLRVDMSAAGFFSAKDWTLSNWTGFDQVQIFGTVGNDEIHGTDGKDQIGALNNGGGIDKLFAYGGNDILRLPFGAVAGSIFDGGDGTDGLLLTQVADYDFTGTTIVDVEQVQFAQIITATFNDDQLGADAIKQVIGTKSEQNVVVVEGADTDLSGVSFLTWGRPDQTISIEGEIFVANDLVGSSEDDTINGGSAGDTLEGGGGTDLLFGNDGADKFVYRAGSDLVKGEAEGVIGAAGTDTVQLADAGAIDFFEVVFNGVEQLTYQSGVSSARFGSEAIIDFDKVTGSAAVDTLTVDRTGAGLFDLAGLAFSNWTNGTDIIKVNGTNAGEIIIGTVENDTIDGKDGNDTMAGGKGDDVFRVGQAGDVIDEIIGNGEDRVIATTSYQLTAGASIERLTTNGSTGMAAIDLTGNTFAQTIEGNAAGNTLKDGGGAADAMKGFAGNDTYLVYNSATTVSEGVSQGTADKVAAAVDYALGAGVQVEILGTTSSAGLADINLTGNVLAQEIIGNAGDNVLHDGGKGAADTLRGLDGDDTYRVFNSADVIEESAVQGAADRVVAAVSYTLDADVHVEIMTTNGSGGTSDIWLTGNEIAQEIVGNAGDNRLEGKGGADTLRGFGGDDTFVFATALGGGNVDTIIDFIVADDRFLLSDAIFTALTPGTLAAAAFRANDDGLAEDASDRIIYEMDTGEVYYDFNGDAAGGGVLFAVADAGLAMTNLDFSVA
jgi:Ca2+-binding RTX toxin-like protein